jgi:pimeloyl-ACP methyl ester carboxylesterase
MSRGLHQRYLANTEPDELGSMTTPSVDGTMRLIAADDGATINVGSLGGGPLTVLFLHCLAGNVQTWSGVWAKMDTTRVRCLAFDFRGTGESQRAPCELTNERLARDALQVADAFGAETFVVVGHSMGGKVGLLLATLAPERVRGLVLIGTPGPGLVPIERGVLNAILAHPGDRGFAVEYFRPWFRVWPRPEIEAWIDSFVRMPAWALTASCEAALWTSFSDTVAPFSCAVLVLVGKHDSVYGLPYQRESVLPYVPNAEVITIDAGHGLILERPEDVALRLDGFLQRI